MVLADAVTSTPISISNGSVWPGAPSPVTRSRAASKTREALLDPSTSTLNLTPQSRRSSKSSHSFFSNSSSVLEHAVDESGTDKTERNSKTLFPDRMRNGTAASRMAVDESVLNGIDDDDDGDDAEDEEETLIDRFRLSRNDAMQQHLYSTAALWGQKVYEMTADPNDAFWLAQIHFLTHQFARAERILTIPKPMNFASLRPLSVRQAKGKGKQKEVNSAFDFDQSFAEDLHEPYIDNDKQSSNLVRLTDMSIACRYLAAQCMVRQGKWNDALDLLGHENPFRPSRERQQSPASHEGDSAMPESDQAQRPNGTEQLNGGIRFEASLCHLRGLIHLHLNANDRAKECFLEAMSIDVKCFESFESLVDGNMMTVEEEWNFVQALKFQQHLSVEDADFVKMAYTVRLKKYAHHDDFRACRLRLSKEFGLQNDPDVLFGLADELYAGFRWADCYAVTSYVLAAHEAYGPALPLHLACMYHIPALHSKLFLLAHELVERSPDLATSWHAVGLWYFANKRWDEARRFFGKAILLDPRFGPSWVAFAHAYAHEGEHDQAITAYSTAQRHFQGTHLPLLFIGMQHLHLSNVNLAQEYLKTAWQMCRVDPLLANEMGVTAYWNGDYSSAVDYFTQTLELAKNVQGSAIAWVKTHLNLGHAWRKLRNFSKARASYQAAADLDPNLAAPYLGLGYILVATGHKEEAVSCLHEALGRNPVDQVAADLLREALEDHAQDVVIEASKEGQSHVAFPGLSKQIARSLDEEVRLFETNLIEGPVNLFPANPNLTRSDDASRNLEESSMNDTANAMEESAMDMEM